MLGYTQYDFKVDLWAAGMILASMIFRRAPFLCGTSEIDQLYKISRIVGTDSIYAYCKENYNQLNERREFREEMIKALSNTAIRRFPPSDFKEFVTKENEDLATAEALDLVRQLLTLDFVAVV